MKKDINKKQVLLLCAALLPATAIIAGGYKGTPFKTHNVPCVIEAEDYDKGGEGVAFHYQNKTEGNRRDYREDPVCIASANGGLVLANTNSGNWTNYTINVAEAGDYAVKVTCASGGDNDSFELRIDGKPASRSKAVPNTGWGKYAVVTVDGLHLKKGKHVFQWYTYGGMNVDKFEFERTGELTKAAKNGFDYKYPLTQKIVGNPLFLSFPSQLYNSPFVGNLYTADPSAHVWNINGKEVLYVYASHDMEPAVGCDRMDRYHIFSTEDLVNWTDHGEMMNADDVKKKLGVGSNGFMWAPDAAYNKQDGKYYFIFPHKIKSRQDGDAEDEWQMFLATSDTPADGPWKLLGYIKGVPNTIDPCLFVDDDGQPYIYTSGAGKGCWGGKLKKDNWLELDGEMTPQVGTAPDFHEAPFVFKKDGKYYLTHSDGHPTNMGGNQLIYAVADSPLGPWENKGVYMIPHGEETAHGSVVQFKGKWYQFYHTANYSSRGNLRSVCFDPVTFNEDGTMNIVRNWGTAKNGMLPMLSPDKPLTIEAEDFNDGGSHVAWYKRPDCQSFTYGEMKNQDISVKTENGTTYLANMVRKEWVRYSFFVTEPGRYSITCRMRQNDRNDSKFRVGIDGRWTRANGIPVASGSNKWGETTVLNVELTPGEHFIEWRGDIGDIDLDKITLARSVTTVPGIIEAEDYDDGGYSFKNGKAGNMKQYRSDKGVAISADKGTVHIGSTSTGDWLNYTFVAEAGTYDIKVFASAPSDGKFSINVDGCKYDTVKVATGGWQTYKPFEVKGVELGQGRHTVTFNIEGGLNFDKMEFVKK